MILHLGDVQAFQSISRSSFLTKVSHALIDIGLPTTVPGQKEFI